MISVKTPYNKPIGTWRFVSKHEILQNGDLTREVGYSPEFYMDPERRMNWCPIEEIYTAWIGKTINDLEKFGRSKESCEIIRRVPDFGEVTKSLENISHQLGFLTDICNNDYVSDQLSRLNHEIQKLLL